MFEGELSPVTLIGFEKDSPDTVYLKLREQNGWTFEAMEGQLDMIYRQNEKLAGKLFGTDGMDAKSPRRGAMGVFIGEL